MNIHEYQGKALLKAAGVPVLEGVHCTSVKDALEAYDKLGSKIVAVKSQIHAGGRGKAGGVKLVKSLDELKLEAKKMLGKKLITHQTGPEGKEVKTLYIEEASDILKEFYLSCLVDRQASKIAFICSTEGGMDIEKVAEEDPKKIITLKFEISENTL